MHIIGHYKERVRLKESARSGRTAQSYLFSGPQGVGKSLCALEFACALVGEASFEPSTDKPYPFDVLIVRPVEETKHGITKTKGIGVEEIREALQFLGKYPVSGKYRVVIIEEAHKLTPSAQNALLKTLEEPNASAMMILTTHEAGSILPTIHSRVEHIRFDFVPEDVMTDEGATLFPDQKGAIAPFFFSLGRPGMIVRAYREPESFTRERELLGNLFRLSTLSLTERLRTAEKLAADTPLTIRLLEWWLPGLHTQALKGADRKIISRFFNLLEQVERTIGLLKTTQSNARLLLEKLFLSV